jgi:Amt family ammonium transporter
MLAAAAGMTAAAFISWFKFGKPDLALTLNGALAGLVGITAGCSIVTPISSLIIGTIAGFIVIYSVLLLDKLNIDDPVGAIPVHGINGLWGTLAVGLFGQSSLGLEVDGLFFGGGFTQLGIQALGTFATAIFVIIAMYLVFKFIDLVVGLRVSREEEIRGLDSSEHGMESYSGFQIFISEQ